MSQNDVILIIKLAFLLLAVINAVWHSAALGCKCLHFYLHSFSKIKLLKNVLNLWKADGTRSQVSLASTDILTDLWTWMFHLGNCWFIFFIIKALCQHPCHLLLCVFCTRHKNLSTCYLINLFIEINSRWGYKH